MQRTIFCVNQTIMDVPATLGGNTPEEALMLSRKAQAKSLCAGTQKHGKGLLGLLNFAEFTARDSVEDLKELYEKNGGGYFAIKEIFKDKATFETAYRKIEERSKKNLSGASCKTINDLAVAAPQPSSIRIG